jgi:protease I
MGRLDGERIAFLVAPEGIEQVELTEPWKAVEEAGGSPERTDEGAVAFARSFFEQSKPVGAICHAAWTLVEADVLKGRTITSWPSLRTDIRNAGGTWVDEEVVVDEGLVSSRNPDDLPAFCDEIVEEFCEGEHEAQSRSVGAEAS